MYLQFACTVTTVIWNDLLMAISGNHGKIQGVGQWSMISKVKYTRKAAKLCSCQVSVSSSPPPTASSCRTGASCQTGAGCQTDAGCRRVASFPISPGLKLANCPHCPHCHSAGWRLEEPVKVCAPGESDQKEIDSGSDSSNAGSQCSQCSQCLHLTEWSVISVEANWSM